MKLGGRTRLMDIAAVSCLLTLFINVSAFKSRLFTRHKGSYHSFDSTINYETFYFDQKIDHFGFLEDGTFKQRYLVADKQWRQPAGPILFYTGNEGDIAWFCNNTGFMWDVAGELGAMLVFAEHRYYGESMPFGPDSYSDSKHLNYLTSEQALADFAVLIQNLKLTRPGAQHSPVIAIGGSYGGMLAAWFRMKYPHMVVGALASSAPIWQFTGLVPCGDFYKIVTQDFAKSGPNCHTNIRASWKAISNLTSTALGRQWLSEEFGLCVPLKSEKDAADFKSWLQETWVNLAMVDYPYEANFLQPLPRWPIQAVCKHLSFGSSVSDYQLLHGVSQAAKVYYNYTGSSSCLNTSQTATGSLGFLGWNYQVSGVHCRTPLASILAKNPCPPPQACTEMVMPMCADGVQDMFEPEEWNFQAFSDQCNAMFGVRPRAEWAGSVYGGKNIASFSNIIFSNGGLDPWSSGGVMYNVSDSLVSIMIPDGAHHLDLRYSNDLDPPSVRAARVLELRYFWKWIQEAAKARQTTSTSG
ncbi:lysosomal Pro-X carboxypeptidase isoform X1 [Dunckerocampus dactyliophorus]|uniref:lysosomal Pro-X carboxypeptidase isoform X1 n=1 Tax=Dunckerocampus dactyliophorus TaxID=161453 RepID=UPI0024049685|nr:lysosomal Pro-X carboxypeptidase isoform X1 [Dunckerocampus dactyliophorus]